MTDRLGTAGLWHFAIGGKRCHYFFGAGNMQRDAACGYSGMPDQRRRLVKAKDRCSKCQKWCDQNGVRW